MAMTVDWPNKLISVPQADLTLISGTLYEMDTEGYFRTELMALMDDEQGMAWPTPMQHNTAVTVAGVTYARVIEIINGYQVQFTPDSQWTVRLAGSNNNIFDVENGVLVQNQVQVIPTNSAGLIQVTTGTDVVLSAAANLRLEELHKLLGLRAGTSVRFTPTSVVVEEGESPNEISQTLTGDGENEKVVSRD